MGHRTLKRVALDFDWPQDEIWKGCVNPYPGPLQCNACEGSGYNPAVKQIADEFYDHDGGWRYDYGIAPDGTPTDRPPWRIVGVCHAWHDKITQDEVQALVDADRLLDFTHTFKQGEGWVRREDEYIPTAEEVNEWERRGGLGGHDAINRHFLIEARAKRLGVYGECAICNGNGELPHPNEAVRKLHDEWEESEPPAGDGYQLWETTSEGRPISPVFDTAEKLAEWCESNTTIFADEKLSKQEWFGMFIADAGSVETGSMLIREGDYTGSEANAPKPDEQ